MKLIYVVLGIFLFCFSLASAISVDDFSLADLGFRGFVVEANLDSTGSAQVLYGKTGALGSTTSLATSSSEHLLQVDGLESGTVYFYRVVGKDSQGNSYSSAISLTRTPKIVATPQPSNLEAKLLFASGFEGTTQLQSVGSNYRTINGVDSKTGFTWPPSIGGSQDERLVQLIGKVGEDVDARIETVPGPNAQMTRALFLEQKTSNLEPDGTQKYYADGRTLVHQVPFRFNMMPVDSPEQSFYVKYWAKVDDYSFFGENRYRVLWAYKTWYYEPPDVRGFRVSAQMGLNSQGEEVWNVKGDYKPGIGNVAWSRSNSQVPFPKDEWFKVEYYLKFVKDGSPTGRVWMRVNDELLFDAKDVVMSQNNIAMQFLAPAVVYGANGGHIYIDDLEVWSEYPGVLP